MECGSGRRQRKKRKRKSKSRPLAARRRLPPAGKAAFRQLPVWLNLENSEVPGVGAGQGRSARSILSSRCLFDIASGAMQSEMISTTAPFRSFNHNAVDILTPGLSHVLSVPNALQTPPELPVIYRMGGDGRSLHFFLWWASGGAAMKIALGGFFFFFFRPAIAKKEFAGRSCLPFFSATNGGIRRRSKKECGRRNLCGSERAAFRS